MSQGALGLDAIPMLSGTPLLGNLREFQRDWLGLLRRMLAECGEVARFRLGPRQAVVWCDPELAAQLLIHQADAFEKGPLLRRLARIYMGDGLITCEQEVHRRGRAMVAGAFHPRRLDRAVELMVEAIEEARLPLEPGREVDVHAEMMRIAIEVIGRALFSTDIRDRADELAGIVAVALETINHKIRHPLSPPLSVPTPRNRRARQARAQLDALMADMLASRTRAPGDRGDVFSVLLEARDERGVGLTPLELRDHAVTLLLAGFETAASALSWTWALLAHHPEVEAQVRDEVARVLGDRLPDRAGLEALTLTRQVIEEAMRLYPPAHTLGRKARRDVQVGPYLLPAGTVSIVSPYQMHRNPRLYPDPERFDPARFAPEQVARRPRAAYLPFGAGPRVCLGGRFAMLETTAILALLMRRLRFELRDDAFPAPLTQMTLRPIDLRATVRAPTADGGRP